MINYKETVEERNERGDKYKHLGYIAFVSCYNKEGVCVQTEYVKMNSWDKYIIVRYGEFIKMFKK